MVRVWDTKGAGDGELDTLGFGGVAVWDGGSSTKFRRPVGVAFDPAGNVYVSNQAGNSVIVLAPPPFG